MFLYMNCHVLLSTSSPSLLSTTTWFKYYSLAIIAICKALQILQSRKVKSFTNNKNNSNKQQRMFFMFKIVNNIQRVSKLRPSSTTIIIIFNLPNIQAAKDRIIIIITVIITLIISRLQPRAVMFYHRFLLGFLAHKHSSLFMLNL